MKYLGVYSLALGGLIGMLCAILLTILTRPLSPVERIPPPAIAPDVTVFVSEASLSRIASETLQRAVAIDFDPNGQLTASTRIELGWWEPVINFGLLVEMQGTDVTSRLEWLGLGFVKVPARLLPQPVLEASQNLGPIIRQQTPPDFALVGLTTSPEGLTFELKWVGD